MAYLFQTCGILLLVYSTFRCLYVFTSNVAKARRVGLPVIAVPINHQQVLYWLIAPLFRRRLQALLPVGIWKRLALTIRGWEYEQKLKPFDNFAQLGKDNTRNDSFLLVGFGKTELWTADPKAAADILSRVNDYGVPKSLDKSLGQYGPNVMTTNGKYWSRHRRLLTGVIDERILEATYEESTRQTACLLQDLIASNPNTDGSGETVMLFDWLKRITINVLLCAAMGDRIPWQSELKASPVEHGYRMTRIQSLSVVVDNIIGAAVLPTTLLAWWPFWLPGYNTMRDLGYAKIEVQQRCLSYVEEERKRRAADENADFSTDMFVSKLLSISESGRASGHFLTDDELVSNHFIFTVAGFETTATTLAYAVVLLARHPEWQSWLIEEVDDLVAANANDSNSPVRYTEAFSKSNRMMAFMLEILRLYGAVPHIHRETTTPQSLQTSNGPIAVPSETRVYIDSAALHVLPNWRNINRQSDPASFQAHPTEADEFTFRPSRWINPTGSSTALFRPERGLFVPWATGPRVCPGKKMAQVEFIAVLLTILRNHNIEAVPLVNESKLEVERRLDSRLRDSSWKTVLQMNGVFNPKSNQGLQMRIRSRT